MRRITFLTTSILSLCVLLPVATRAGPPPGREGPPPRGRGPDPGRGPGRGPNFDTMESLRIQVNATPEEWWVLLPLIQRINLDRGTINALANDLPTTSPSTAPDSSADERKSANAKALKRAQSDIDTAQKDLRLLLTPAQQIIMTKSGYLAPSPIPLRPRMIHRPNRILALATATLACLHCANTTSAYVNTAPGLAEIVSESQSISVVEISAFDRENHLITYKQIRPLKGTISPDPIQHQVAATDAPSIPTAISQWAAPGVRAVLFSTKSISLVCIGNSWYSVNLLNGAWKSGKERPDLPLAYCGTISRLADAVQKLAAGKDAIATVVSYGADDAGTAFDLAFHRTNLPGLARLDRVHVSPNVLGSIGRVSSMPGYVLGEGPVDADDLPALIENLTSKDATIRAEAAADIGCLKSKAKSATAKLTELLHDPESRVQLAAAAALLRITPNNPAAVDIIRQALNSTDTFLRRDAAKSAGIAGPGAAPLTEKLAALLKDPDQPTRSAALLSITTLGPLAASAADAIRPLLDDPSVQCDAADALGRIGAAARPIPDTLIKMLASPDESTQWAAIRAMSQIGGKESHPAVEFMIKKIPTATVTEGYDIRIYLAMLGPDAIDALPALQSSQLRNGKLSVATEWAIESSQYLPWTNEPGMAGQPGGVKVIYDAYINNLGTRLAPATKLMATKMVDGTVGTVPIWGYRLLTCAPDEALKIFTPHLADNTQQMRKRAIVGLGYMGPLAAPARQQLTTAQTKATDDREKLLLAWSLRQIDREE